MYSKHHPAFNNNATCEQAPPPSSQSHPRIIADSSPLASLFAENNPRPSQARSHALALPGFQFSFEHHLHPRQKPNNPPSSSSAVELDTSRSVSDRDLDHDSKSKSRTIHSSHSLQPESRSAAGLPPHQFENFAAQQTAGQLRTSLNGNEPFLKRQLSVRERFARPAVLATLSTQELAGSPRERWEAVMMSSRMDVNKDVETVEDLGLVVSEQVSGQDEKENSEAATPKTTRHLTRRSISQPLILQAPYTTPVPAKTVRRVNSISVGSAKEEIMNGGLSSTSTSLQDHVVEQPRPSPEEDVATLIAESGSAEAALKKVLEEKNSIASRSEQLWRLVEKQRAMMLDLNKNLERALKEKDRYKLKLKETLANNGKTGVRPDIAGNDSRAGSVDLDTMPGTPQNRRLDKIQAQGSPHTPQSSALVMPVLRKASATANDSPFSSHQRNESMLSDAGSVTFMEATPVKISPLTRATAKTMSRPQTPQDVPPPRLNMPMSVPKESQPQSRKSPPTPLNLKAIPKQNGHPTTEQNGFYSDSDYSGSPIQITTPTERGRRRTRTEDEIGQKVAEPPETQRGSSIKSLKKSKAQSFNNISLAKLEPVEPVEDINLPSRSRDMPTSGLPASPRPRPQPFMARPDGNGTAITSYSLFAPLQSPGLPLSPRPIDRLPNAFAPRAPKTPLPLHTPLSEAFTMASLPLSPREPRQFLQLPSLGPMELPSFSSTVMDDVSSMISRSTSMTSENAAPLQDEDNNSVASDHDAVYRGLVSDAYPELLLPPHALNAIEIRISCPADSTTRHDSPIQIPQEYIDAFTLDVIRRADQQKLWTAEKLMSGLPTMHHSIKSTCNLPAMLPQDSPFANEVKVNVQLRQAALTQYFKVLLDTQLSRLMTIMCCLWL